VVLNDNAWSIDKNVGAIAEYFHKIVTNPTIAGLHDRAAGLLERFGGKAVRHMARKAEEAAKGLIGPGMLFEEFGLSYYGPMDGHNLPLLIETFKFLKQQNKPVVLHAITQKGAGSSRRWRSRRSSMGWGRTIRRRARPSLHRAEDLLGDLCGDADEAGGRQRQGRRDYGGDAEWDGAGSVPAACIRSATSMWGSRRSMR
jgi:hypothetical protein